jgi:hypothetical protein
MLKLPASGAWSSSKVEITCAALWQKQISKEMSVDIRRTWEIPKEDFQLYRQSDASNPADTDATARRADSHKGGKCD